jgi:hypothetical protein
MEHAVDPGYGPPINLLGIEPIPEGNLLLEQFIEILKIGLDLRTEDPREILIRNAVDRKSAVQGTVNNLNMLHSVSLSTGYTFICP